MKKIKYDKLIRDNIPEIIIKDNGIPKVEVMEDEEYFKYLVAKMDEELKEIKENYNPSEIADLIEVLISIAKFRGVSEEDLNSIRLSKKSINGGFDKKLKLIEVEK